jgi:hypothetical protein
LPSPIQFFCSPTVSGFDVHLLTDITSPQTGPKDHFFARIQAVIHTSNVTEAILILKVLKFYFFFFFLKIAKFQSANKMRLMHQFST